MSLVCISPLGLITTKDMRKFSKFSILPSHSENRNWFPKAVQDWPLNEKYGRYIYLTCVLGEGWERIWWGVWGKCELDMLLRKKEEHKNKQLLFNFSAINPRYLF